jgi:hypothetical protein
MTEKSLPLLLTYVLDVVIVLSLTLLAALGKLDPVVVVGVLGPMIGAKVGAVGRAKKDGSGPSVPPSALILLAAGAWKIMGGRASA